MTHSTTVDSSGEAQEKLRLMIELSVIVISNKE